MENKVTIDALHFIFELFRSKEREYKDIIDNLQIDDVKEEKIFIKRKAGIKKQILLSPVSFKDPKIAGHHTEEREVDPCINPLGGKRKVTIVEVEFPFDGSPELFEYRPDSVSYSDPTVYLPSGNSIIVEVETATLDKTNVQNLSRKNLALTISIINSLNGQIEGWSKRMESIIDETLAKKRTELMEFYG
jgi:hypothetical protein